MPALDWIGRQAVINHYKSLPYHMLTLDKNLSVNIEASEGNILVHGDNLIALKALLPYYGKKVKFCYIDVPYNTGNEGWIYNDAVNDPQILRWLGTVVGKEFEDLSRHDKWLCMMYPRLQLIKEFLADDGFICVQIDEAEGANLKVIMDEIFFATNYMTTFYVQVRYEDKTLTKDMMFHKQVEQILVYRKTPKAVPNLRSEEYSYDKFNYVIEELAEGRELELDGKRVIVFKPGEYKIVKRKEGFREGLKEIWASGKILDINSSGRFFRDFLTGRKELDGLGALYKAYGIGDDMFGYRYFTGPQKETATRGKYYQGVPLNKLDVDSEIKKTIPNFYDMAADFGNCRHEGGVEFNNGKKPEKLLAMLLEYFTQAGDLVLDSFAGSGTTPAVATKMKRRWIAVELGEHCYSHTLKRLTSVAKGEDGTGVSEKYNWEGGSGFSFCELSEPITGAYGMLNRSLSYESLARHIYYTETREALDDSAVIHKPYIGSYGDTGYFLLYASEDDTVLDKAFAMSLEDYTGTKVVYADRCNVSAAYLKNSGIIFKQIPYQVEVR